VDNFGLQGKVPLVSTVGTGQLQLLIFALAGFHAFSCLATFLLGEAMVIIHNVGCTIGMYICTCVFLALANI